MLQNCKNSPLNAKTLIPELQLLAPLFLFVFGQGAGGIFWAAAGSASTWRFTVLEPS